MSDNTLELDLHMAPPEVSPAEMEQLVTVLLEGPHWLTEEEQREAKGWMTAAQIANQIEDMDERQVRKVAAASAPAVVSYPGSPGYKLWGACTVDEIGHAIAAFEAQGNAMIKRAHLYRQAYYRRFRGASKEGLSRG